MKVAKQGRQSVSIVGPGRVGQAMGKLLARAGVPVLFIASRRLQTARRGARFVGSGKPIRLQDTRIAEASIILVTTADAAIAEVASELATLPLKEGAWEGKVVLHTCGSLSSGVLRPLKSQGAAIGSLHPFQTVPNPAAGVRNLQGCFWGVEGDRAAQLVARQWVRLLGGIAFPVRPARKIVYHLAAFLVCPTLVTLLDHSERLLSRAGVPLRIARPMLFQFVAETAKNFLDLGGRRALTGPAVRADWLIVRRHLAALKRLSPDLLPAYRALLPLMLRLAGKRKVQNH